MSDLLERLRRASAEARLALDLESDLHALPYDFDARHSELAELLLAAPTGEEEFGTFHAVQSRLRESTSLDATSSPEEWRQAALSALIAKRLGRRFAPFEAAANAERCGAPREPWARWLDDPAYASWKNATPLLAPWSKTERGIVIMRDRSSGPVLEHLITSLGQVSTDGETFWSLIVDGGPSFHLRDEDIACLERTFGRSRFELGGRTFPSSATTPDRAIAEPLVLSRADAIEAFVPPLVEAIDRSLALGSIEPLVGFLEADGSHAPACWWFAQALVGRAKDKNVVWNASALAALRALVGEGTTLEPSIAPSDLGGDGLVLVARRDDRELAFLIDGFGRAAVSDGENWVRATFPETAAGLLGQANEALYVEDNDRAIELLQRAVELGKDDAKILVSVGEKLLSLGETEDALAHLERAVTLGTDDAIVHFHRGAALHQLDRHDEALEAFTLAEGALADRPRMVARANRATVLSSLGQEAASLALLQQNAAEFPSFAEAWYGLGLALVKLGRYDESIAATTRALELDAELASGHYSIACAFALRSAEGDVELALHHIGEAIAHESDLAESIATDDDFRSLADDPRFLDLIS